MAFKIFVDSDVVISSLISQAGAAYLLIHNIKLDRFISNVSFKELVIVAERLDLGQEKLSMLIENKFKQIQLKKTMDKLKKKFEDYVLDINDAHIVAGAVEVKAKFLVTYNVRHFKEDKIRQDFGITVITPANLIQYLRSQD